MNTETFSLTDFVGGDDNAVGVEPKNDYGLGAKKSGREEDKQQSQATGHNGLGKLLRDGLILAGGAYLAHKYGGAAIGAVKTWGAKEFGEVSSVLNSAKEKTFGFFSGIGKKLESTPGKMMGSVKSETPHGLEHAATGTAVSTGLSGVSGKPHSAQSGMERSAEKIAGEDAEKNTTEHVAEKGLMAGGRMAATRGLNSALVKNGVKFALKGIAEDIPIASAVVGTAFAAQRAWKGDYAGAAMEEGAGIAACIPGFGTLASIGISGALALRDWHNSSLAKNGVGSTAPETEARNSSAQGPTAGIKDEPTGLAGAGANLVNIQGGAQMPLAQGSASGIALAPVGLAGSNTDLSAALQQVGAKTASGAGGSLQALQAASRNIETMQTAMTNSPGASPRGASPQVSPLLPNLSKQLAQHPEIAQGMYSGVQAPDRGANLALSY